MLWVVYTCARARYALYIDIEHLNTYIYPITYTYILHLLGFERFSLVRARDTP